VQILHNFVFFKRKGFLAENTKTNRIINILILLLNAKSITKKQIMKSYSIDRTTADRNIKELIRSFEEILPINYFNEKISIDDSLFLLKPGSIKHKAANQFVNNDFFIKLDTAINNNIEDIEIIIHNFNIDVKIREFYFLINSLIEKHLCNIYYNLSWHKILPMLLFYYKEHWYLAALHIEHQSFIKYRLDQIKHIDEFVGKELVPYSLDEIIEEKTRIKNILLNSNNMFASFTEEENIIKVKIIFSIYPESIKNNFKYISVNFDSSTKKHVVEFEFFGKLELYIFLNQYLDIIVDIQPENIKTIYLEYLLNKINVLKRVTI